MKILTKREDIEKQIKIDNWLWLLFMELGVLIGAIGMIAKEIASISIVVLLVGIAITSRIDSRYWCTKLNNIKDRKE